jgi:hypothetical protein
LDLTARRTVRGEHKEGRYDFVGALLFTSVIR